MDETNNPSQTDPGAEGVTTPEGGENVDNVSILDAINTATGRSYATQEEAINGIKETTSYVGKVGKYRDAIDVLEKELGGDEKVKEALSNLVKKAEPVTEPREAQDPTLELRQEVERLKEETFFNNNKSLEPYKEVIKSLKKDGQTLSDVVESNKNIFEKLSAHDESQTAKSVIHSNSRLTDESSDYAKDFKAAKETGNWAAFLEKHKGAK